MQRSLDGREVEWREAAKARRVRPLGPAMRYALWLLDQHGVVSSTFVGTKWHAARARCSRQSKPVGSRSLACCQYASTDGNEIMKRLAKRGLAQRKEDGWART